MAAPNGVQPTVCRVIFIYNLAQLVHVLYFIFTILKICFLFKSGVMKFSISHVLNLQTVNWKGGGDFPVYSSELVYQD